MLEQVIMVNSRVLISAPSQMLPVFAVILLAITVAIARMGTMGKRTMYPSAISSCHIYPVVVKQPYWIAITSSTPNMLKNTLIRVLAHWGILDAR